MTAPVQTSSNSATSAQPLDVLDAALRAAFATVTGIEDADPILKASNKPEFGDYQANGVMAVAKQVGMKPRPLAEKIVAAADVAAVAEPLEVAGPGFINIRLKPEALAAALAAMDDESLGVERDADTHPIAIDLCGVNVSKQMHVGHLRSTIIGDALARVLERRGRTVHRENHVGDWGLPIAMVLRALRQRNADWDALTLGDLDAAYRDAQLEARADVRGLAAAIELHAGPHRMIELEEQNAGAQESREAARQALVALQRGDESIVGDWRRLIEITMNALYEACDVMNVRLSPENTRGESFYRDKLAGVVEAFTGRGVAERDKGAIVVRFPDRERPMLIQKSDGGYLYATTDMAAIQHRTQQLAADRLIYVVDARQRDHFRDLFEAAAQVGWDHTPDGAEVEFTHVAFGAVLGEDRKPLKTRSGDNVTLKNLLDEACERGTAEVRSRAADANAPTHGLGDEELRAIGRQVGIGAIKYADLSSDLIKDYVFDFERMLSFEGNTGPYMQYAHARICSIFARAGLDPDVSRQSPLTIEEPAEKKLALALLRYGPVVADVARTLEPHRLCTYLYELAEAYSGFYQQCPVIQADSEPVRASRLRLCNLVRRVLAGGLDLLGIEAPQRM